MRPRCHRDDRHVRGSHRRRHGSGRPGHHRVRDRRHRCRVHRGYRQPSPASASATELQPYQRATDDGRHQHDFRPGADRPGPGHPGPGAVRPGRDHGHHLGCPGPGRHGRHRGAAPGAERRCWTRTGCSPPSDDRPALPPVAASSPASAQRPGPASSPQASVRPASGRQACSPQASVHQAWVHPASGHRPAQPERPGPASSPQASAHPASGHQASLRQVSRPPAWGHRASERPSRRCRPRPSHRIPSPGSRPSSSSPLATQWSTKRSLQTRLVPSTWRAVPC